MKHTRTIVMALAAVVAVATMTVAGASSAPLPRGSPTRRPPNAEHTPVPRAKVTVIHGDDRHEMPRTPRVIVVSCHARGHGVTCTPAPRTRAVTTPTPTPGIVYTATATVTATLGHNYGRATLTATPNALRAGDPRVYLPVMFNVHRSLRNSKGR